MNDYVVWGIVGAILIGAYVWYATIVTRRNRVEEALGGIDVQLQQRHDLIPNVLEIAKRFMGHEKQLLEEITALRSKATARLGERDFGKVGEKFAVEDALGRDMGRLLAIAENYPQLKSDGPMIQAQRTYAEVETNIAAARRFYNSAVGDLRNATQIFPGPVLSKFAGVAALPPFFETAEAARKPVAAADILNS